MLGHILGIPVEEPGVDEFVDHPRQMTFKIRDPVEQRQVDPAPDNRRAIRCYEKAGFRRVDLVNTPDGEALLMFRGRD